MNDSNAASAVAVLDASSAPGFPCSWDACQRPATHAIRFHGQAGHVHDCSPHTAELREWADVAEVMPLPCPWTHGATWTDQPKDLT